jgi:hypothetical protein
MILYGAMNAEELENNKIIEDNCCEFCCFI